MNESFVLYLPTYSLRFKLFRSIDQWYLHSLASWWIIRRRLLFSPPPPLYPFSAMESIFLLKRVVSHASHTHTRAFSTNFGQRWKSRLVQTLVFPLFFNFFFFLWTWVSKGWKDGDMIKRLPSISKRRGVALSRLITHSTLEFQPKITDLNC